MDSAPTWRNSWPLTDFSIEFMSVKKLATVTSVNSHVLIALSDTFQWRPIVLPDCYIGGASRKQQLEVAGLTGRHIAATALTILGRTRDALLLMR